MGALTGLGPQRFCGIYRRPLLTRTNKASLWRTLNDLRIVRIVGSSTSSGGFRRPHWKYC